MFKLVRLKIRRALPIVVLIMVLMIGNILAYFTDMDTATNEFTTGRISIDLQEPNWDPGQGGELVPGYEIPKDPQVLNDGINDAFVFVTVDVPYQNVTTTDEEGNKLQPTDTELFSYDVKDGWVQVGEPDIDTENNIIKYVYAYSKDGELTPLKPEDTTTTIFDFIQFEDVIEDEGLEDTKLDVVVKAYGIQTDNIDGGKTSPEDVWPIVDKSEINEYDTDIALEDIVIDYGLPVTIEASKLGDEPVVEELSYATHGTVEIDGDSSKGNFKVTYTLTEMLSEMDTVHLVTESGEEYTFNVIPATTMYYEENFNNLITFTGSGWKGELKDDKYTNYKQELGTVGNNIGSVYGFDKAYLEDHTDSNGTSYYGDTSNGTIRFIYTFTGTGTSFFARTSPNTGYMQIKLYKGTESTGSNYISIIYNDTYYKYENSNEINDANTLYNIPVYTESDLPYGTYTVVATIAKKGTSVGRPNGSGNEFYLDGIRIYNPANNGYNNEIIKNAYLIDNEAYPEHFEIRDKILEQGSFNNGFSEINGAVFMENNSTTNDIVNYENDGPKNEVYLKNNQKIAFRLSNENSDNISAVHLGAKAPFKKGASVKVYEYGKEVKTINVNTSMDMYYDITDYITWEDGNTGLIVIECNGEEGAVASITNMKITYKDESAGTTSALITKDDIDKLI